MFLAVDKPKGITSHDVIDELRRITGIKKIGHAGTLDPNATGLLIVGIGRESTKRLGEIVKTKKEYEAEIVLGEERNTDDVEGFIISKAKGFLPPNEKEVKKTLLLFKGKQKQMPPVYSAVKHKGKEAYKYARKGKSVILSVRNVEVYSIVLQKYKYPQVFVRCRVSSGTYIRSLARDIGKKLGCGAYLKNLRRTTIGRTTIEKAVRLNHLNKNNWKDFAYDIN